MVRTINSGDASRPSSGFIFDIRSISYCDLPFRSRPWRLARRDGVDGSVSL
jgi:hypothetical protein